MLDFPTYIYSYLRIGIREGWEVCHVKVLQNLEDQKNEYIWDHTLMFKRKKFPPIFPNNMNCQVKGCYGKEIVKYVAVLIDI